MVRTVGIVFACVAGARCGASRLRRGDPNRELGQSVGGLIHKSDEQLAANVQRGEPVPPAYQASLADSLSTNQEVLVNPNVSEAIAQANSMAAHDTLPKDLLCSRSWEKPCPDGWASVGTSCAAPASYQGPCGTMKSFARASSMDKYKFAVSCNAPWQCMDDTCSNGRNYDGCPTGWTSRGNGFCQGAMSGQAACGNLYKMDNINIGEKQELARSCGFNWPCEHACEQDYTQDCPKEWSNAFGLCVAPATYAGSCGFSVNTTGMTANQKHDFAVKCETKFACTADSNGPSAGGSSDVISSDEVESGPVDARTRA
jgi:CPW-WPC domain-containing protein